MFHPARIVTVLVVLTIALAGWAVWDRLPDSGPTGPTGSSGPTGASGTAVDARHNHTLNRELTTRWRGLEDVLEAQAGYDEASGTLAGSAVCGSCDRDALASRLTRDLWWGEYRSVVRIRVQVAHESDRARPVVQEWDPQGQAAELFDRYGVGFVDPDDPDGSD